jgi:hypothetical protein
MATMEFDMYLKPCRDDDDVTTAVGTSSIVGSSFLSMYADRLTLAAAGNDVISTTGGRSCSPDSGARSTVTSVSSEKLCSWEVDFDADEYVCGANQTDSDGADSVLAPSPTPAVAPATVSEPVGQPIIYRATAAVPARPCLVNGGWTTSAGAGHNRTTANGTGVNAAVGPATAGGSPLARRRQLSLPANLVSFKNIGDSRRDDSERRRRFSAGVKFADEVGENLTTFAIIPSRFDDVALPKTQSVSSFGGRLSPLSRCPKISHFRAMAYCPPWHNDDEYQNRKSNSSNNSNNTIRTTNNNNTKKSANVDESNNLMRSFSLLSDDEDEEEEDDEAEIAAAVKLLQLRATSHLEQRRRKDSPTSPVLLAGHAGSSGNAPTLQFRLSFEQPAADPPSFQRRLDQQLICLENVKVVEATGGSCTGSVLCSVRVKSGPAAGLWTAGAVDGQQRKGPRVFARCTDNDWESYADIVAQRLVHPGSTLTSGSNSSLRSSTGSSSSLSSSQLSLNAVPCQETYSFAVQRPLDVRRLGSGAGGADVQLPITRAVEFALCYEIDERRAHWDNNGGRNYRIEWTLQ